MEARCHELFDGSIKGKITVRGGGGEGGNEEACERV